MDPADIRFLAVALAGLGTAPGVARAAPPPCAPASSPAPPVCSGTGHQTCAINFNGLLRTYNLYVPTGIVAGQAVPFLFALHGRMGTGPEMEGTTQFDPIAEQNGFVVAYPTACSGDWQLTDGSDVQFLDKLLQTTGAQYSLDARRTYVSGFSEGGELATLFTCDAVNNGNVAGLAVVSTDLNAATETACAAAKPVTYLLFHGISDPISYYLGGSMHQGQVALSAAATAKFWQSQNRCVQAGAYGPIVSNDTLNSGSATTDELYGNSMCANGATVGFYTIGPLPVKVPKPKSCKPPGQGGPPDNGGGHTWPSGGAAMEKLCVGPASQELPASSLIWQTLSPHTAP